MSLMVRRFSTSLTASHGCGSSDVELESDSEETKFEESLIKAVKKRRILYVNTELGHKDGAKTANAWAAIGEELGASAEQCKDRWKNLRDGYSRNKRVKDRSYDAKGRKSKPYKWAPFLTFLDDHLNTRKTRSSYGSSEISDNQCVSEDSGPGSSQQTEPNERTSVTVQPAETTVRRLPSMSSIEMKKQHRKSLLSNTDSAGMAYLQNRQRTQKEFYAIKKSDEATHFAMLVADQLREFPDYDRRELQLRILMLIHDFRKAD